MNAVALAKQPRKVRHGTMVFLRREGGLQIPGMLWRAQKIDNALHRLTRTAVSINPNILFGCAKMPK